MTAPAPQPIVSGTGSGMGARLAALATAVALIAVVWIGVSGRATAPPPVPSRPAALTPSQIRAVPPEPITTPDPAATPRVSPAPSPSRPAAAYVIAGLIGGADFRTKLVETAPGGAAFSAHYLVPNPVLRSGTLAFEITPALTVDRSRGDTLGVFLMDLETLAANHRTGLEGYTAEIAGRPRLLDAPLPVRRGFDLRVSVKSALGYVAMVDFQLQVVQDHASARGNDGIVGCLSFSTCDAQD